jgi:hypothetical protein
VKGVWVPHDTRAQIADFVEGWSEKTGIRVLSFLVWLGIATSKWHSWKDRYGKANEHNAWVPGLSWRTPATASASRTCPSTPRG